MVNHNKYSKATLLKNAIGKAVYDFNYHRITFKIVDNDGGVPYGYSPTLAKWAHLYPNAILIDGEGMMPAKRLSIEMT